MLTKSAAECSKNTILMMNKIKIIACSIFKNELEYLKNSGEIDADISYINSMYHMYPIELKHKVEKKLSQNKGKALLIYGDCFIDTIGTCNCSCQKVDGINCCDIFLGRELYNKFRKEGAFILFAEWVHRWEDVFKIELGFKTSKLASSFMNHMHKYLLYIDFGICEIPHETLEKISNYVNLPYKIEKGNINCFLQKVKTAILKIQ